MRAFAITGIVTASWMPRIMSGSDMRATPPSRRMSAGTRSSAMTAHAPAASATFACSASTTSMITPPLSISARPLLTLIVPISCMGLTLAREERLNGRDKALGLLEEREVARVFEQHHLAVRNPVAEDLRGGGTADEVVHSGDRQRVGGDAAQVGP